MGIDSPYCVHCATREKIDFSRIFLWSERKVALDMRATFLYRIFVCFVLEVLLYFFFIPRLYFLLLPYAACCVLFTVLVIPVCLCTLYSGQLYSVPAHSLPRFGGVRICQVINLFIHCDPVCVSILIIFTDYLQHSSYYLAALFSPFTALIWPIILLVLNAVIRPYYILVI